eukprot:ANDGO_04615.mRNA.1 putative V-type proton ATPase subunit H
MSSSGLNRPDLSTIPPEDEDATLIHAVRGRRILWSDFEAAAYISSADAQLMTDLQREDSIGAKASSVSLGPDKYCIVLLKVVKQLSSIDALESVLVLLNDLMGSIPDLASRFVQLEKSPVHKMDPFQPFARLLRGKDTQFVIVDQAAQVLARLLVADAKLNSSTSSTSTLSSNGTSSAANTNNNDSSSSSSSSVNSSGGGNSSVLLPGLDFTDATGKPRPAPIAVASPQSPTKSGSSSGLVAIGGRKEREEFLDWLSVQLRKKDHREIAPAVDALAILMQRADLRAVFAASKGARLLPPLLRTQTNHLLTMYNVCISLWLLSFNKDIASELHDSHVVAMLHDTLLRVNREKILRVSLGILQNLVDIGSYAKEMISVGLFSTLKNMSKRKFGDADITELCNALYSKLDSQVTELSTFDSYLQEVMSGRMDWTPAHRSEQFWRDNIDKFEANEFTVVKELINLLSLADVENEADARTVAVVCHDLGEFVRHHARGRKIINALDAKTKVMKLMSHNNEQIRKEALLSVQKMMVQNWDFM